MIEAQLAKYTQALAPISVAGGATATVNEIDTVGFDYAEFIVCLGLVGANGITTLKVQESDVSGSGQADITGASFTAPVDADDNKVGIVRLDLRKRKRYLTPVVVNGATNASVLGILVRLSRAEQSPDSAAERGATLQELTV